MPKCGTGKPLCGCGRPVRYIISGDQDGEQGSCNKYMRCPSWDELNEKNRQLDADLKEAAQYVSELVGCWSWKKGERAGNAEEFDTLLTFVEKLKNNKML